MTRYPPLGLAGGVSRPAGAKAVRIAVVLEVVADPDRGVRVTREAVVTRRGKGTPPPSGEK